MSSPPQARTGKVGPSLDGAKPDAARVVDVVTNGKGVMPAYRDRLTTKQIEHLAAFVSTTAGLVAPRPPRPRGALEALGTVHRMVSDELERETR